MRVGLLEDNPTIQDCITAALEIRGHTVFAHSDGSQFLESLVSRDLQVLSYDVVVVDLGLPGGLSGEAVIELLVHNPLYRSVGIVVYSGADGTVLSRLTNRFPGIVVVQKPVVMEALLRYMHEAIRHRVASTL